MFGSLLRILRTSLRPYARQVALVVALLLLQAMASLYLPNLTADIINNGVARGDLGYIWRIGGVMLAVAMAYHSLYNSQFTDALAEAS